MYCTVFTLLIKPYALNLLYKLNIISKRVPTVCTVVNIFTAEYTDVCFVLSTQYVYHVQGLNTYTGINVGSIYTVIIVYIAVYSVVFIILYCTVFVTEYMGPGQQRELNALSY